MNRSVVVSGFFADSVQNVGSFEQAIRLIASCGFYQTAEFYFEGSQADRLKVKQLLQEYGLSSVFLAGYPMKKNDCHLGDLNDRERQWAIQQVKQLINQAYFYGSGKMLIVSGKTYAEPKDRERSIDLLAESIRELCEYAELQANGDVLEITLEYFNDQGEPHHLLGPTALSKSFAEQVRDRFGRGFSLTFDLSHAIQLGEQPEESLQSIASMTSHIHLANCVTRYPDDPFYGDKHPPFGWANSDVNHRYLRTFVQSLKTVNFQTPITVGVEVITPAGIDRTEALWQATELFRTALEKLDS